MIENMLHSAAKLFLTTLATAALTRAVLTPNYSGGVFAVDPSLFYGGAIMLTASAPAIGVIALLSQSLSSTKKPAPPTLLAGVTLLAVLSSGAGQLLSAAIFSGRSLAGLVSHAPALIVPVLLIGCMLTFGVWLHFKLMRNLIMAETAPLATVMKEAAIAAGPTLMAAILAASALSPLF